MFQSMQYAVLKRVLDRLQLSDIGLGKRASDPLDHSGFGFSKRSFDRVDSSGFGLGKRTFNGRKDKSCFSFAKKMAIIRMPKVIAKHFHFSVS
uniref:Uncharacterized protein n=1 Tax=Setaria digitata TaxID=48799 RepID=A0A915Q7Q6_9BILA